MPRDVLDTREREREPRPRAVTVLDHFSGRATTGVVVLRYGRHYVGIELNPADVAASEERLRRIDAHQPSLEDLWPAPAVETFTVASAAPIPTADDLSLFPAGTHD